MEVSRSRYPRMRPRGYLPHTRVGHLGRRRCHRPSPHVLVSHTDQ